MTVQDIEPKSRFNKPSRSQWPKGKSGNPRGRPPIVRSLQALAKLNTERAFRTLMRNMRCGIPSTEVEAAKAVLDRGWGKAPIKIDMEIQTFESFSPEARAAIDLICQLIAGQASTDPSEALDITPTAIEEPSQSQP